MLTKGEFLDRLRENPLPEDVILQNSSLICGLFYYYGIHCRADEEAAECFWRGEVPKPCPAAEPGACGQTAAGPEAALRLALRYSLQGEDSRREAQEHFLEEMKSEFAPGKFQEYMADFACTWEGYDCRDPRPEQIREQAEDLYDEADFTDWKENQMSTIGVYDPEPGTCFRIYRAAELLYRLAAIGGNLRALEEDVPENEYLNETEFEDWIWEKLAQAVRDAEEKAAEFQRQENYREAVRWWTKSAAGGNPSGIRGLTGCLKQWREAPDRESRLAYWRERGEKISGG